jgi:hypothetical protein
MKVRLLSEWTKLNGCLGRPISSDESPVSSRKRRKDGNPVPSPDEEEGLPSPRHNMNDEGEEAAGSSGTKSFGPGPKQP